MDPKPLGSIGYNYLNQVSLSDHYLWTLPLIIQTQKDASVVLLI